MRERERERAQASERRSEVRMREETRSTQSMNRKIQNSEGELERKGG